MCWQWLIQAIQSFYLCIFFVYGSRHIGCRFLLWWILNVVRARCRVEFLSASNRSELFVLVPPLHYTFVVMWYHDSYSWIASWTWDVESGIHVMIVYNRLAELWLCYCSNHKARLCTRHKVSESEASTEALYWVSCGLYWVYVFKAGCRLVPAGSRCSQH